MQENNEQQPTNIQKVHLKGYKSIRDLTIELKAGLNIIIGANGSGKTNFLEFLDAALWSDYSTLLNGQRFEAQIETKKFTHRAIGKRVFDRLNISYEVEIETSWMHENQIISQLYSIFYDSSKKLPNVVEQPKRSDYKKNSLFPVFLRFENLLHSVLKNKLELEVIFTDETVRLVKTMNKAHEKEFKTQLRLSGDNLFLADIFNYDFREVDLNKSLKDVVNDMVTDAGLFEFLPLVSNLGQYSPITDIKIDWSLIRKSFSPQQEYDYEGYSTAMIEGIDFQFQVNNEWLNWTQLSDGTKRLFYLIGSVTYAQNDEVVLIEEPELGVHPHQLSQLMNFLKEQSQEKQIIITTHSPQVLNCLNEDELDRIIVARHEGKAGTQMYHLSEEEKGYVSDYMKNQAFLSDYWTMSGFINEEPTLKP